jgi:hypothetical protein
MTAVVLDRYRHFCLWHLFRRSVPPIQYPSQLVRWPLSCQQAENRKVNLANTKLALTAIIWSYVLRTHASAGGYSLASHRAGASKVPVSSSGMYGGQSDSEADFSPMTSVLPCRLFHQCYFLSCTILDRGPFAARVPRISVSPSPKNNKTCMFL